MPQQQQPVTLPPPPASSMKASAARPSSPSSYAGAASNCEKCSIHTKNTQDKVGEVKHSNAAACGEWLSCICGTVYFVLCWSCTLSGEVKSHKETQGRRGSAATGSDQRKGSAGSTSSACTCSKSSH